MYPRNLLFYIVLISTMYISTISSAVIRPYRLLLVRLSPEPIKILDDIPDVWKMVHPENKAPQMEIHLMKGQVSPNENWAFSNDYKYSNKYYENAAAELERNENESNDDMHDNMMPDKILQVPAIGSRNVINPQTRCPEGQRKDANGVCRDVLS